MIAQRLVLDGGYPDGIWRCPGCTAKLTEGVLEHPDDCAEATRLVPAGADDGVITAAIAGAINAETGYVYQPGDRLLADMAAEAYKAAAPLIIAAERERIRQMAIKHKATYPFYSEPGFITDHPSFADLIGEMPLDRWTVEHSVECRLPGETS